MRYAPGSKGPTLPGPTTNLNDPRLGPRRPMGTISNAADPKPASFAADPKPASLAPAVSTRPPSAAPTGPKIPVRGVGPLTPARGGGMLPKSIAVMTRQKMKKGGKVKCMAKGGSASKRADGIAAKGKTKGRII